MKKLIMFGLLILLSVSCIFGQTDVNSQKVLLGLNDFITEPSENWQIYNGRFVSADTINEEYTFIGSFIVKVLMSTSRYNFVCSVTNNSDDFSLEISKMESYICDKNGKMVKSGTINETSQKVAEQYAAQMKNEIKARIANISDESIETSYTKVVTSPSFVNAITNTMSELALKKFIEKNIDGKEVELEITLSSIDENRNPITNELMPLNYRAYGYVDGIYKAGWGHFIETKPFSVFIYSNNDKLVSLKIGGTYKAKGKVRLYSPRDNIWLYEISEE